MGTPASKEAEYDKKKNTVTKKKIVSAISQESKLHPNEVRLVIQSFLEKMTKY